MKKAVTAKAGRQTKRSEGSRNTKAVLVLTFFLSALFLIFTSLLGDKSLFQLQRMRMEKESWVQKNAALADENKALRQKIQAARKDPFVVEKIAREELGMVKENEVVYLFDSREIREVKEENSK
jgi:cell division protein FtsB